MQLDRRALLRGLAALLAVEVASACRLQPPGASSPPSPTPRAVADAVVYALPGPPDSLDPSRVITPAGEALAAASFDTLVGRGSTLAPQPALAERWSVTADGRRYTLTLRPDVRFHDGSLLTTEAVQLMLERLLGPQRPAGRGSLVGVVHGVRPLDQTTVEITLNEPHSTFLSQLALVGTALVSPASLEASAPPAGGPLAGTGPLRYIGVQNGAHVLERWERCWRGAPAVDRVAFVPIPDRAERLRRLLEGSVDLIAPLGLDQLAQLADRDDLAIDAAPSALALGIAINTQVAPFTDLRVRQALNYGIDRADLVASIYQGRASALSGPLGAALEGAPPLPFYPYDPTRARALLAAAGYSRGLDVQLLACKGRFPADVALARAVAQQLQVVGVRAEVNLLSSADYITALTRGADEATARLILVGSQPADGTALAALHRFFHSSQWAPKGQNASFFRDPRCDDLLDRAWHAANLSERDRYVWQALELIQQQAPWIFLVSPHVLAARSARLREPLLSPLGWATISERTWLAAADHDEEDS